VTKLSRRDWCALGLSALAQGGAEAVTLDALCRRAGLTRGSFYHHFRGIDVYLQALGRHWREVFTVAVIAETRAAPSPAARLGLLNALATRLDPRIERGMRALASRDPALALIVESVDVERTGFIAELYEATGRFSAAEAAVLAAVEYAAFVGFHFVRPGATPDELGRLYEAFARTTGRGAAARGRGPRVERM